MQTLFTEKILSKKYPFTNERETLVCNLFLQFENEKDFRFFMSEKTELLKKNKIHLQYNFHYQTKYFILLKFVEKISIRDNFKGFEKVCTFFKTRAPRIIYRSLSKFLFEDKQGDRVPFIFPKLLPPAKVTDEKILLKKYLFTNKRETKVFNLLLQFENEKDFRFFMSEKTELLKKNQVRLQYNFHYQTKYFILFKFVEKISIRNSFKEFEKTCTFFKTRTPKLIVMHLGKFLFEDNPPSCCPLAFPKFLPPAALTIEKILSEKYLFTNKRETKVSNLFLQFENEKDFRFFMSEKTELLKKNQVHFQYNFHYQTKYFILFKFVEKISIRNSFKEFEKTCTFFKTRTPRIILTSFGKFLFEDNPADCRSLAFPKFLPTTSFPSKNKMYPYFFLKRKSVKHLLLNFQDEGDVIDFLTKNIKTFLPYDLYPYRSINAFEIEKSFFVLMAWENPVFLFSSLKPKFEAKFFTLQSSKKFSKDYFSQKYISPF